MPDKTWKAMERKVAKTLCGKRIPVSGAAPGFKGDVSHPVFFIECKHGKQIPKTIVSWFRKAEKQNTTGKATMLVVKPKGMHGELVIMRLEELARMLGYENFC